MIFENVSLVSTRSEIQQQAENHLKFVFTYNEVISLHSCM
jgi:hypothetical protein